MPDYRELFKRANQEFNAKEERDRINREIAETQRKNQLAAAEGQRSRQVEAIRNTNEKISLAATQKTLVKLAWNTVLNPVVSELTDSLNSSRTSDFRRWAKLKRNLSSTSAEIRPRFYNPLEDRDYPESTYFWYSKFYGYVIEERLKAFPILPLCDSPIILIGSANKQLGVPATVDNRLGIFVRITSAGYRNELEDAVSSMAGNVDFTLLDGLNMNNLAEMSRISQDLRAGNDLCLSERERVAKVISQRIAR